MKRYFRKPLLFISVAVFLFSCGKYDSEKEKNITIIYTNDEHGWIEKEKQYQGASGMVGAWKDSLNYDRNDDKFLVLSGGDMWTGPAISTWFEGASTVAVMNKMGYDAAVLGNHEFDFKVSQLQAREKKMNFPILSANIRERKTSKIPSFVTPYIIKKANGINVGIIGLSSITTSHTAIKENVTDYLFLPYDEVLKEFLPKMRKEGAEIIIIIGHICEQEMRAILPLTKGYNIPVIGGGHCHREVLKLEDGVLLMETGSYLKNYIQVQLSYNSETKKVRIIASSIEKNTKNSNDLEVEEIITFWQQKVKTELSKEIGYCSEKVLKNTPAMGNMITDSWLKAFPEADVAYSNFTSFGQDLPKGAITLENIIGVLPYVNTVIKVDLKGKDLLNKSKNRLLGGMNLTNGNQLSDGRIIHKDSTYTLLTSSYLYGHDSLETVSSKTINTKITCKKPLVDWIKSLETTSENPLNNYIDKKERQ